jgi:small subunit ribosomal protein S4e
MGKKGGRNRIKSIAAPRQWNVPRKSKRFVTKPSPGPYSIDDCYALGVALREILGVVQNRKETERVLNDGEVLVDGVARKDPTFPVGLFNVIAIPRESLAYRLVPSRDGLVARQVPKDQAALKLCRIRSKSKIAGGHTQYGFHDGRTVVQDDLALSPGDSVLLKVPEQSVVSSVKLSRGTLGLVLSGERAGTLGTISDVKKGTMSRDKMVAISLPGGETELPARLVFPVGTDRPTIEVEQSR